MVKVTMLLLFTLLFVLEHCWYATSLVINPAGYSGGKASGDPAPGRSPGPPPPQPLNDEQQQIKTVIMKNIKCNNSISNNDSNNKLMMETSSSSVEIVEKTQEESLVNVTLFHRLFKADLIVTGIEYQVVIERLSQAPVMIAYTLKSTIDNLPNGKFIDDDNSNNNNFTESNQCNPSNIYKNRFLPLDDNDGETVTSRLRHQVNWTTSENVDFQPRIHNLTFELNYQVDGDSSLYTVIYPMSLSQECQLRLNEKKAIITSSDFPPHINDCQVWFPSSHGSSTGHGIVIELTRLNVPCSKGYIHFSGINTTSQPTQLVQQQQQQQQHFRSHRQTHICGKLEELPENDRRIYFPFSHTSQPAMHMRGSPIFALAFRLVDYCYNVTFVAKNGSFELQPTAGELQCTFKIYLPYGNRVALTLQIGGGSGSSSSTSSVGTHAPSSDSEDQQQPPSSSSTPSSSDCDGGGLETQLLDGDNTWSHCTQPGDAQRQIEVVSRENKVVLRVNVRRSSSSTKSASSGLGLRITYRAEPIDAIVGVCGFGWVAVKQFCVAAVEEARLPWSQAEMECGRRGGHLASIRNEHAQTVINNLLLNSPGYRDHNAYWIGASDKIVEGDFRWSDGLPFSFTNWFPGWSQHGHYNRQPNDDGLSEQDCVEARRIYSLPTSTASLATAFMWNDRDCSTPNYFICERLQNDEPLEDGWPPDCNRSVELSRQQPRAVVSSPGFPRQYPDNADCDTDITAPPGYRLVLDFEELVLENETLCSYDYLEIHENTNNNATSSTSLSSGGGNSSVANSRRLCGDWSSKLKLLRYVSNGSKLKLRFSSDYSHHFGGYKARVSMESAMQCSDDRLHLFNNSCYLFVSYPEVTWPTAQQICRGKKGELSSILSSDEERFITTNIRKSLEYRTSALYWLGARTTPHNPNFTWTDNSPMTYKGWLPSQQPSISPTDRCLSVQWTPSPTPMLPSGLYWQSRDCNTTGGYVCKRPTQLSPLGINFNKTVSGAEGVLTTPHFPETYYDHLDFTVKISAPTRTRIVAKFTRIDIESQIECLYDFVQLASSASSDDSVKFCGSQSLNRNFTFVSHSNSALLTFHSDYSIAGSGFSLSWRAVDVSACPQQTLTAKEGFITSPNFPHFLLAHLDCTFTILAPVGKRVWLEFLEFDVSPFDETLLQVDLGGVALPLQPFAHQRNLLTDGVYVSSDEKMRVKLKTRSRPFGTGFRASYKIISSENSAERVINLNSNSTGTLLHLNYPDSPPSNVDFVQHFIAPPGYVISLQFFHVKLMMMAVDGGGGGGRGTVEVYDNYYDSNGSVWKLCYDVEAEDAIVPVTPISITSFLNTLHVRQRNVGSGVLLNASLRVQVDEEFKTKLLKHKDDDEVEGCVPNPCQNGGKCVTKGAQNFCQCVGHFTGLFCALTKCELEPCVFGTCHLTNTSYKCRCKSGYTGATCEQKRRPCEGNPCESRGVCVERGDGFFCRCHAWWEGTRCEKRMLHIPYKPLSERMFHEPFWLGLMTVFVVMAVIGLVWCAKRHFPEKIEKLLAEENERNRGTMSSLRSSSVREQLAVASAQTSVTVTPSPGPAAPRSLFGRLGIRKPSILSLTSPHASAGYVPATARTFSLDDLLKPLPRRSPSPKKKRNNSTPTKKNAAEKKQILQQLISPAPGTKHQLSRKVSLGELMQMTERKPLSELTTKDRTDGSISSTSTSNIKETKFSDIIITTGCDTTLQTALSDPKLEKKVTFARLLNKVSAEMSSGSEMELGIMQTNRLGCVFARPSSTPPSPNVDARSPNSTSSNQGSDSFTSSDLAIPSALSSSISDLMMHHHHHHHHHNNRTTLNSNSNRLPNGRQKPASADSILAMFRNFSASSAGVNLPQSLRVSPSTTPTASSPQDDIAGDDESSTTTSSAHTPVSFSSGYGQPDSPVLRHQQIEVPVLDPLSAHKSSTSGSNFLHPPTILLEIPSTINKCLSPIREMPTPLPSPAITPIMRRSAASSVDEGDTSIEIEIPNISISDDDDVQHCIQDIAIDPHAEDGLILEEAAAMQTSTAFRIKNRPPPLGETAEPNARRSPQQPLVIPMLTIQTPSPTHTPRTIPSLVFPGSPPPHKESPCSSSTFNFPQKQTRKMFKDFDKPTSLDLPCAPPMITITCNLSEAESDAESISPSSAATKTSSTHHLGVSTGGMSYLSPFSRSDHNASESNLSSSGYSSMASPGPSRCGSSNPLCPSEMEDQGPPGSGNTHRRHPSPVLKTTTNSSASGGNSGGGVEKTGGEEQRRGRSDSETLSDDPLLESNDEGIGTDHIDEKIEEGDVKSAKELEVFMVTSSNEPALLDIAATPPKKSLLQLPSIIVQCDPDASSTVCEKLTSNSSPVSSRSESPLSDHHHRFRFSPHFYGRHKDFLPFTDSDGLYDFPSSEKVALHQVQQQQQQQQQHKKTGRKQRSDRKSVAMMRNCKTPSPTKPSSGLGVCISPTLTFHHLDVPCGKDVYFKVPPPRKLSPKRRVNRMVSSSSSSDSINSGELRVSSSSPSPDTIRWSSPIDWIDEQKQQNKKSEAQQQPEDTCDDASAAMLPKPSTDSSKQQKISRLRAISHQIRFLRRLEQSLKRRERTISPCDSLDSGGDDDGGGGDGDEGDDSPGATSPLLQRSLATSSGAKVEIMRKSSSIGKLQANSTSNSSSNNSKSKKGKYKRAATGGGELLLPPQQRDDRPWGKRIVIAGNAGHSD